MIFQKPVLKSKANLLDIIGYTLFVSIISSYVTYGFCTIYGVSGGNSSVTALDIFNGLAAIATASAFFLGLMQYRKSIIQQRQSIVAVEAKSQIDKMIKVSGQILVGEDTDLDNLNEMLSKLSNIAVGFDELYRSMAEDVHRAIVRMQWQDMYYNSLVRALNKLDLVAALNNDGKVNALDEVVASLKNDAYVVGHLPAFRTWALYERLMRLDAVKKQVNLKSRLGSLDMFIMYYMNKYNVDDLMYGLMSTMDIRVHAPLLAVAEPSPIAFEDYRNK